MAKDTTELRVLECYQKCINRIDDFLEYRATCLTNLEVRAEIRVRLDLLNRDLAALTEPIPLEEAQAILAKL